MTVNITIPDATHDRGPDEPVSHRIIPGRTPLAHRAPRLIVAHDGTLAVGHRRAKRRQFLDRFYIDAFTYITVVSILVVLVWSPW